jgi:hypothetical protein
MVLVQAQPRAMAVQMPIAAVEFLEAAVMVPEAEVPVAVAV